MSVLATRTRLHLLIRSEMEAINVQLVTIVKLEAPSLSLAQEELSVILMAQPLLRAVSLVHRVPMETNWL